MISFALGELKCPSYDYVLRMTWAEFLIRSHAYYRQEKNDWVKVREISYWSYVSGWMSDKKPPSKEKFMPLSSGMTKKRRELIEKRMLEAVQKYKEEVSKKNKDG